MKQRIKQYLLIALAAAALYFILDNHIIISKRHIYLLKKESLVLHNTFVSLDNKKPETILKIDRLRDAGIGELMVELGLITEDERSKLESKYSY